MRLIDADALRKQKVCMKMRQGTVYECDVRGVTVGMIDRMPTIDAVPVVRCKDCKKAENREHEVFCSLIGAFMGNDDFCSYGERKDGAT